MTLSYKYKSNISAYAMRFKNDLETEEINFLWDSFLKGNEDAYANLYKKCVGKLYSYACNFTADKELVKDSVQEIFIELYIRKNRLKEIRNVKLYMMIAIKNRLFNVFKKDKLHFQIDTIEPVFHIDTAEQLDLTDLLIEQKTKIAKLLEQVTPRQRELIYYKYAEELSYEEICELMQMNYQSVRNLLHRTLTKIRKSV